MHVELEEEDGTYWMSVVSKVNPVMVKGRRYGPGTRLTLKSGDSFEMGEFEVQVVFPEKARPAPPPPAEKKSLIKMLAEEGESDSAAIPPPEPGIFDEPTYVGGSEEPTYIGPAMKPAPAPAPKPPPAAAPAPRPAAAPVAAGSTIRLWSLSHQPGGPAHRTRRARRGTDCRKRGPAVAP